MEKTAYEIGLYFALHQAGFDKLAEQLKDAGFAEWSRVNLPTFRRWLGLSGQLGHDALTTEGKQVLQRTIARGAQQPTFTARLPAAKSIRAAAPTTPVQMTPAQLQEKAMREAALKRAREQFQQQQLAIQGGQG